MKYLEKNNFTVIELFIVISILATLMTLLLPSLKKVLNHHDTIACQAKLKIYYISNELYADDHNDSYVVIRSIPWKYSWFRNEEYLSYFGTKSQKINKDPDFSCPKRTNPSYNDYSYAFNWYNDSWHWNTLTNRSLIRHKLENTSSKVFMVDHTSFHSSSWSNNPQGWLNSGETRPNLVAYRHDYGANASFGDGHVEHRVVEDMYFGGDQEKIKAFWQLNGDAFNHLD